MASHSGGGPSVRALSISFLDSIVHSFGLELVLVLLYNPDATHSNEQQMRR